MIYWRHDVNSQDFIRDYQQIDVLVNNAAVAFKDSDPTPFQRQARPTLQTNFFGTVRLTLGLLPLLHRGASPRIVNVASMAGALKIFRSKVGEILFTPYIVKN